jgi:hypothetical protein
MSLARETAGGGGADAGTRPGDDDDSGVHPRILMRDPPRSV